MWPLLKFVDKAAWGRGWKDSGPACTHISSRRSMQVSIRIRLWWQINYQITAQVCANAPENSRNRGALVLRLSLARYIQLPIVIHILWLVEFLSHRTLFAQHTKTAQPLQSPCVDISTASVVIRHKCLTGHKYLAWEAHNRNRNVLMRWLVGCNHYTPHRTLSLLHVSHISPGQSASCNEGVLN